MRPALADHNFNDAIVRGLRRRLPEIDIVAAREIGLASASDDELLSAAAELARVVLSHDARTLPQAAYLRSARNLPVEAVVICPRRLAVGPAIDDLELMFGARPDDKWDFITWLPLR